MTFCSVILMSDGRLKRITAVGGKPRRYFYHLLFAHYPSREVLKPTKYVTLKLMLNRFFINYGLRAVAWKAFLVFWTLPASVYNAKAQC
jgi:hypothetical protein